MRDGCEERLTWFYQADQAFVLGHFVLPALRLTGGHLQLLLNSLNRKEMLSHAKHTGGLRARKR